MTFTRQIADYTTTDTPSNHSLFRALSEHPIPCSDDAIRDLQATDWSFAPRRQDNGDNQYTRSELIDEFVTVLGEHGDWEILDIQLTALASSLIAWNTNIESGFCIDVTEGDGYEFARALAQAVSSNNDDGASETVLDDVAADAPRNTNAVDSVGVLPVDSHPLLRSESEREKLQENDASVTPHTDSDRDVIHQDTLYCEYKTMLADIKNGEYVLISPDIREYENILLWWTSGLGQGLLIDTTICDVRSLARAMMDALGEQNITGDGACPKCRGEIRSVTMPYGSENRCSSCDFTQIL